MTIMSPSTLPAPRPASDPLEDESVALLVGAATDWRTAATPGAQVRARLLDRVARSARASAPMYTVRLRHGQTETLASGVTRRELYAAAPAGGLSKRPGEPMRVSLIELAPGADWQHASPHAAALQHDWLVLRGALQFDALALQPHDYHVRPAGSAAPQLRSEQGALLYWRETDPASITAPVNPDLPLTTLAQGAVWHAYGPGIQRRLLWQAGTQGAFLIHALPGAAVPGHSHQYDEECLMLDGELFLDDVLLRRGEYQLAPGGSRHVHGVSTDTGVLIYAHGDLDLLFD
jgi:quercetin dioxygenase-like cupin family protein